VSLLVRIIWSWTWYVPWTLLTGFGVLDWQTWIMIVGVVAYAQGRIAFAQPAQAGEEDRG
jgi:hypothetical protein